MELRNQNEVAQTDIDRLSSPNALRKRWESNRNLLAGFVPIPQASLVLYPEKGLSPASELRAVSNDKR